MTEKELNAYFWKRLSEADFAILYDSKTGSSVGVRIESEGVSVKFIEAEDEDGTLLALESPSSGIH